MLNFSVNKWKKILISILFLSLVVFILSQLLQGEDEKKHHELKSTTKRNGIPLVIWWTPLLTGYSETRMCDINFCKFSTERQDVDNADVSINKTNLNIKT